jgi:undecaprenyl diphosphate synthase
VENLRRLLEACVEYGIEILTIYAFSTENWNRPESEVQGLITILEEVLDHELKALHENGVQLRHIGKLDRLSSRLQDKIRQAIEVTKDNDRLILNVAWNYGGRAEIVHAIQAMIRDGVQPDQITEDLISRYMYTCDSPDPDLIIRTSGEMRVSNFLIWQGAYSELYVTPHYWPDFGPGELLEALHDYAQRERRYGQVLDPVASG